jgi:Glycosyl hydrolases family 2, TIM barrel domain
MSLPRSTGVVILAQRAAALILLLGFISQLRPSAAQAGEGMPTVVKVQRNETGYYLLRNGKPYVIKGGGGRLYLEALKDAGGNSLRTWGEDDLEPLLDRAHELGLTVTVGIWLGQERQGFNYNDAASVHGEVEKARSFFRRYRRHPAVLMWGLGNEMEGSGDNPIIWRTVNEIAKVAKSEDPDHPTMTVIAEAGGHKISQFMSLCPDVDVLGINSYAGLATLPKRLAEAGLNRPYVITEFGPPGPWEVPKTSWGAPVEPTSTEKARSYLGHYANSVAAQSGQCLGSYAFLWGHKQEATATWFGMFLPSGERLGAVDAMTFAWTNRWPANRAPELKAVNTQAREAQLAPGTTFTAKLDAADPDGDPLVVRWEVRSESTDRRQGGDREAEPQAHPECFVLAKGLDATFRAPTTAGAYRVFAYVYDGKGGAACANVPFAVKQGGVPYPAEAPRKSP